MKEFFRSRYYEIVHDSIFITLSLQYFLYDTYISTDIDYRLMLGRNAFFTILIKELFPLISFNFPKIDNVHSSLFTSYSWEIFR